MKIPKSHPRRESLNTRELIVNGVDKGVTSIHGLIAHGRSEAFDYLLGEKTNGFALNSIEAASALLLSAKNPVISVNGNAAALVPRELGILSKLLNAPLEVNIFHPSKERALKIRDHLLSHGAIQVLLPEKGCKIKHLNSSRKYVNKNGIYKADVVFVPLEDGDRTEALIKNGKKVITVDLNPLSRTARNATITIVDNLVRAIPLMISGMSRLRRLSQDEINGIIMGYSNKNALTESMSVIGKNLIGPC